MFLCMFYWRSLVKGLGSGHFIMMGESKDAGSRQDVCGTQRAEAGPNGGQVIWVPVELVWLWA